MDFLGLVRSSRSVMVLVLPNVCVCVYVNVFSVGLRVQMAIQLLAVGYTRVFEVKQ